jgi:hypothetical protein
VRVSSKSEKDFDRDHIENVDEKGRDQLLSSLGLAILAHLVLIGWLWRNYAMTPADPALDPTGSFLHWVILWTLLAAFVTIVFRFFNSPTQHKMASIARGRSKR